MESVSSLVSAARDLTMAAVGMQSFSEMDLSSRATRLGADKRNTGNCGKEMHLNGGVGEVRKIHPRNSRELASLLSNVTLQTPIRGPGASVQEMASA